MIPMGAYARYPDTSGEISRKHGHTLIGTLRTSYGSRFAKNCTDDEKLSDVLRSWMDRLCLSWFATIKPECFL
jgi:hypothetical protein